MRTEKEKRPFLTIKRKQLLFYIAIVGLPVLQFICFYVYTNIQGVILAFQEYDYDTGIYSFIGLENFKKVIQNVKNDMYLKPALLNSIPIWLLNNFVALPFSFLVGFYMYKKMFAHKIFMVIMILPSVLSSLIFSIIFKYLADRAIPALWEMATGEKILGLLADAETIFPTLVIWGFWHALSGSFLMLIGSMNGSIEDGLIEAANLDGCGLMGEFWHIALPCIYPMIVIWYTNAVAGFFSLSVGQLPIFGTSAPSDVYTTGYYMTVRLMGGTFGTYPYLSALGLCFTAISFPLTLAIRRFLEHHGPTHD